MAWYDPRTWTKKKTTNISNIPQEKKGVIVTDINTGESVTTYTTNNKVTNQTYNPSPIDNTAKQIDTNKIVVTKNKSAGRDRSLELANQPGGLVDQSVNYNPEPLRSSEINQGKRLNPSKIDQTTYTGEPPKRYEENPLRATGYVLSNLNPLNPSNTYGIIGQQGLKQFYQTTFIQPFEYVGKPKINRTDGMGYNINPINRGTVIGMGLSSDQVNRVTPLELQDTRNKTYYQVNEDKKRQLFLESGVDYIPGESADIIPYKISDQLKNDKGIRAKYEIMAGKNPTDSELIEINKQYNEELNKTFRDRTYNLNNKINVFNKQNRGLFVSPGETFIRTSGTVAEVGAITLATAYGGSGLTYAASAYLGANTFKDYVDYRADYPFMTTGQRVTGAGLIALEAGATALTLNSANKKYFAEWRNIRYEDLANQRSRVLGYELTRDEEKVTYNILSRKSIGTSQSLTTSKVDIYPIGEQNAGFFTKGKTVTRILDPETSKYIFATDNFKVSGNIQIPNKPGFTYQAADSKIQLVNDKALGGYGQGIYRGSTETKNLNFISVAQDNKKEYYNVIGAKNVRSSQTNINNRLYIINNNLRGDVDSSGVIFKKVSPGNSIIDLGGSSRPNRNLLQVNKNVVTTSMGSVSQSQTTFINTLSNQKVSSFSTSIPINRNLNPSTETSIRLEGQQINKAPTMAVTALVNPQTDDSKTKSKFITDTKNRQYFARGSNTNNLNAPRIIPVEIVKPIEENKHSFKTVTGNKNKGIIRAAPYNYSYTPISSTGSGSTAFAVYDLRSSFDEAMNSNIIKGGKRSTQFTPSSYPLIFKVEGSYKKNNLSKSGLDYRPITKGFKIFKGGFKIKL